MPFKISIRGILSKAVLIFFIIFWAIIFYSQTSPANTYTQESEDVQTMETVVVSATKTPIPSSQLTSSVHVMTDRDFEQRKIKSMVEALQFTPGVAIFQNGGPGGVATARIRGGTGQQILVVLDGAIMNSPTLGGFDFGKLMVDNIERVEILRGGQSMLWGSDAIGGVINISTKRGRGKPTARAFAEYGSFNSIHEGGQFSGQQGPLDFDFSLSRWDVAGFSAVNFRRGALERDRFGNWQGSVGLGLALPNEGRVNFNFLWLNGDRDRDLSFKPGFDTFKGKGTLNQYVYSGTYKQPITSRWEQVLTLSRQTEDTIDRFGTSRRNVNTGAISSVSLSPSKIDTVVNRIEWQHNVRMTNFLLVNLGYQFREGLGKNLGNFERTVISSHSGFGLAQVNVGDRLFATAGVRQNSYNIFGDATTYRVTAGFSVKETGTKIRSSYGTGFRVPTINDLVFPGFGKPDVIPEKSQSFDIGIDQALFKERLNFSVTYFWNRYRNLLTSVISNLTICGPDPFFPSFAGSCAANIGIARSLGWEFGVDSILVKDRNYFKSLTFKGQYTYTLTREIDGLNPGTRLARWPVDQASGILSYQPIVPLYLNLEVRLVGGRYDKGGNIDPLGAFTVLNLSGIYEVNPQMEIYARVDNLLDEEYEEVLLFGTPVRSIFGGVRMNFEVPIPAWGDT